MWILSTIFSQEVNLSFYILRKKIVGHSFDQEENEKGEWTEKFELFNNFPWLFDDK